MVPVISPRYWWRFCGKIRRRPEAAVLRLGPRICWVEIIDEVIAEPLGGATRTRGRNASSRKRWCGTRRADAVRRPGAGGARPSTAAWDGCRAHRADAGRGGRLRTRPGPPNRPGAPAALKEADPPGGPARRQSGRRSAGPAAGRPRSPHGRQSDPGGARMRHGCMPSGRVRSGLDELIAAGMDVAR